jgi:hypothetical protein
MVTTRAAAPHDTISLLTTKTEGIREGESTSGVDTVPDGVGAPPGGVGKTDVAVLSKGADLTSSSKTVGNGTSEKYESHRAMDPAALTPIPIDAASEPHPAGQTSTAGAIHNDSHRLTEAVALGTAAAVHGGRCGCGVPGSWTRLVVAHLPYCCNMPSSHCNLT